MEIHCLITSQWCKLLTGTRGVTNNDNDPQGTTVQFACCEKGTWCQTLRKIFQSKAIAVNLSPKVRNLPLRHASFKVLKGVVPKSTSWIMSWCRQEVTRRRRALMNPTSMTWNRANEFGGENDMMIHCSGRRPWKNGAWMYCSGWDTGEFSEQLLLNIPVTLTMDW